MERSTDVQFYPCYSYPVCLYVSCGCKSPTDVCAHAMATIDCTHAPHANMGMRRHQFSERAKVSLLHTTLIAYHLSHMEGSGVNMFGLIIYQKYAHKHRHKSKPYVHSTHLYTIPPDSFAHSHILCVSTNISYQNLPMQ